MESLKSTHTVKGMTCRSCENTIVAQLKKIPDVVSARADHQNGKVYLEASRSIDESEVSAILKEYPKFSVEDEITVREAADSPVKSWYQTYRPLILLFLFVLAISAADEIRNRTFDRHSYMNHVMAGFFLGLSYFKFLDRKAFAESFAGYDPVARVWKTYGIVYPFIELGLGLVFITGLGLAVANGFTILILSATTAGVLKRVRSKNSIACACLGTTFSLPLSYVTVGENLVMIGMAFVGLFAP